MASRYSAARPKRDGETFARAHHADTVESDSKRVKFDVRDPSKLAPDAREDDAILDADVIGAGGSTKRGAVNIDGYDSDSDTETYKQRANKKGDVNILEQMDNYDARDQGVVNKETKQDAEEEEDDDMFAADDDEGGKEPVVTGDTDNLGKKDKGVRFMEPSQIQGEELRSTTGGTIRLDDNESSDDEEEAELRLQEEAVDEEVGAGGLKRNAPKVEAFNLKDEMEDGQFDQEGNYIRKAGDPDARHDNWLEGVSKKEMKKAADAHQKRVDEARQKRIQEDGVLVSDLLTALITHLEKAETPLEALARLGKKQTKPKKHVPKWKLKKLQKDGDPSMAVGTEASNEDEQLKIKSSIDAITDAADKLFSRDYEDIYDQERELLIREYRKETGDDWFDSSAVEGNSDPDGQTHALPVATKQWEFRWSDGRDGGQAQGPYDGPTMQAWKDAGYFGEGVEFRVVGETDWTVAASFS